MSLRFRIGPFTVGSSGVRLSLWRKRGGVSVPLLGRSKGIFGVVHVGPARYYFNQHGLLGATIRLALFLVKLVILVGLIALGVAIWSARSHAN
jgi:hypothetical protein